MGSGKKRSRDDGAADAKAERKAERKRARRLQRMAAERTEAVTTGAASGTVVSTAAAAAFLALHEITVHEQHAPPPCMRLDAAPFPAAIVRRLCAQKGFTIPSGVQAGTWPLASTGRDILAIAKTGSGKTLGFLLPALARCMREKPSAKGSPVCLVMAPTRELVLQIVAEAEKFLDAAGCRAVAVYGGASKDKQMRALSRGCELIVATPGRLMDMLDTRNHGRNAAVSVASVSILVLDEADRMLDMGFERDIRSIVQMLPDEPPRQTLFYSATWPAEGRPDITGVAAIAEELLRNDSVKVTVGKGDKELTANKAVTQRVRVLDVNSGDCASKWEAFLELMAAFKRGQPDHGRKVIVFSNMKAEVKRIHTHCSQAGFSVDSISGDRSQSQRESTLRKFRAGSVSMLIATDVAARGLDILGVERVINYDFPLEFADYIHRIGRTGRAGARGSSDTLFVPGDKLHAKELVRVMKDAGQVLPAALTKLTSQRIVFE